jgi:predicted RNA-binding Zn-ribbon protein involved in translation (DUF1610 family)
MPAQTLKGLGIVCRLCEAGIPLAAIGLFEAEKMPETFVFDCPNCGEREIRRSADIQYLAAAAK